MYSNDTPCTKCGCNCRNCTCDIGCDNCRHVAVEGGVIPWEPTSATIRIDIENIKN